jgi:uncharacterized protein YyaL (SSP411 family)
MNRLAAELSPYLRQHAGNPVDWFPWGEGAFAKARGEQKPIFLSIGYSTCHWCHVMAHESFEDPAIAALLNDDFVAVKVDREERPDVDRVYMAYVQARTGHGGWPLSVWLTPELKPFYGGTYFPPEDRGGRAGFPRVLEALARSWRAERANLEAEADRSLAALRAEAQGAGDGGGGEVIREEEMSAAAEAFEMAFRYFHEAYDPDNGGFGGAPKFPRASNLDFLFRCAALQGVTSEAGMAAARMCGQTLRQMARGGIHDQVGGGFHRYSVDAEWLVPHFEKMLYDQAQIAINALEAWQATGDERQAWLARDILDYALRDLAAARGGFYAAEDADSGPEGAEGAFYLWTKAEIEAALPPGDAAIFCSHFGVVAGGNVPVTQDPHGEFRGKNILAAKRTLEETARIHAVALQEASDRVAASLDTLRSARERRPRPHRDEKILAAWNGLMISALARASVVPADALADRREAYLAIAVRTAGFIRDEMGDQMRGTLFRSWREGGGGIGGFAEDYAFCIQGLLDLYEADFDHRWLQWAGRLQAKMDELFWDEAAGGYFNSAAGATDIVVRLKEDYDGAEPAPSSVAASNLFRFAGLFGDAGGSARRARLTIAAFRSRWGHAPQALPQMLCALELALAPPRHVVLVGEFKAADFKALAAMLHESLGPRRSVIALDGGAAQAWLAERAPWLASMRPVEGRAAAYVCDNYTCRAPVTTGAELRSLLDH